MDFSKMKEMLRNMKGVDSHVEQLLEARKSAGFRDLDEKEIAYLKQKKAQERLYFQEMNGSSPKSRLEASLFNVLNPQPVTLPECFSLSDVEIFWFEKMLKGLSEEQRGNYDYPSEIPFPRLAELCGYLRSDKLYDQELQQEAFEYLYEVSPLFRKYSDGGLEGIDGGH